MVIDAIVIYRINGSKEQVSMIEKYHNQTLQINQRYLEEDLPQDDNIDNHFFEKMLGQLYPTELQLLKPNSFDTEASYLDLDLSIKNGIVSSKIHEKRDDFHFEIKFKKNSSFHHS